MGNEGFWMVINHEEQYSIWPTDKEIPREWKKVGIEGSRQQCMDYFIEKVWNDMRPRVINPFG